MILIAQVAQLRELEQDMTAGKWKVENGTRNDDYIECSGNRLIATFGRQIFSPEEQTWLSFKNAEGIIALRNAAPTLLEVLGAFQLGDAALISQADIALDSVRCIDDP